jgi:hypothetical protein
LTWDPRGRQGGVDVASAVVLDEEVTVLLQRLPAVQELPGQDLVGLVDPDADSPPGRAELGGRAFFDDAAPDDDRGPLSGVCL